MHPSTAFKRLLGIRPAPGEAAPPAPGGFQHAPHSRRTSLGWRIAAGTAIFLVVGTGLWHLFGLPIARALADPVPPPQRVETIDTAAAASLAASFTADYWSYSSSDPAARATALAHWSGGLTTFPSIEGVGQLRADVVTPGAVVTAGEDLAIVQTRARVTPELLTAEQEPARVERDEEAGAPRAAHPAALTSHHTWAPEQPLWLSLDVVVTRAGDGLAVTAATLTGGAELGDTPTVIERPTVETDGALSGDTLAEDLPADVFGAYAAGATGQLDYLTSPDVQLSGLSSAVALADVRGWSIAADRADTGDRYVTADVTWQLAGTPLMLTQPYALTLTDTDGRWLLGSIGPRTQE